MVLEKGREIDGLLVSRRSKLMLESLYWAFSTFPVVLLRHFNHPIYFACCFGSLQLCNSALADSAQKESDVLQEKINSLAQDQSVRISGLMANLTSIIRIKSNLCSSWRRALLPN